MMTRTQRLERLIGPLIALALLVCTASADVSITGNIDGNTINYAVEGLDGDTDHTVTVEHLGAGGQSTTYSHTSSGNGSLEGSGTPGNSTVEPGDTVRVRVSKDGRR